jgi:single-stranded DNA-binding protein
VNRVELAGVLSDVAPVRFIAAGMPVLDFTLALTDARWNPETSTHDAVNTFARCHAYGTQVEQLEDGGGLAKGDRVHVLGKLSQRRRLMPNGQTEAKTHVEALTVSVLARKRRPAGPEDPWSAGG